MRRLFAICAVLGLLLATSAGVAAAGAGAVSYTQTFHDATEIYHAGVDPGTFPFPCGVGTALVTYTYDGVFHVTVLTGGTGAGTSWATGTMTGAVAIVPDDPALPSYSGRLTEWFGDNNNLRNGTEAFTGDARLTYTASPPLIAATIERRCG